MRCSIWSRWVAALLAAIVWSAPVWATQPAQTVRAVWVSRAVHFTYQGFTTHYTCSGLKNSIVHLLGRLGARDLRVSTCPIRNHIVPFPAVHVTMRVLIPAARGAAGPFVAARWRRVRLYPSTYLRGNCALMTEFRRTFLPLFAARNIEMDATCVPHRHIIGNKLYAEVLAASPPR
jgi:hypothetical protein